MYSLRPFLVFIQKSRKAQCQQIVLFVTSLQFLSMLLLTAQQTGMPFLVRSASKGSNFLPTTSVFMMEVLKVITCVLLIYRNSRNLRQCRQTIQLSIWKRKAETMKVCVPAFVYALQNNLYYVALANIDATTYSVTYQLRILTTALLAVFILGKRLSKEQWIALLISLAGVVFVQVDQSQDNRPTTSGYKLLGIAATFSMCWTSAFAGVYFEKMLKNPVADMWIQNLRLSLMTLIFATGTMFANDGAKIREGGFFQGWSSSIWWITIINSIGGLAVSLVMKHADNVKKTYCQTIAIGLTAIISIFVGDRVLSFLLLIGVGMVITSVFIYSFYPPMKTKDEERTQHIKGREMNEEVV